MKINRKFLPTLMGKEMKKLFLIMKLTWFLTLILTINASASLWSQTTKMNVKLTNSTIQELFRQIEENSEYRFFYNNDDIDVSERVSIDLQNKSVGDILTTAFTDLPYSFKEVNNNLILVERSVEGSNSEVGQQQNVVYGRITNTLDEAIPGVTVVVKGTTQGTITDTDGNYSISEVPNDATLVFSFVGMKTQEIPVTGKTTINVTLEEETIGLEEVVAVGYGTQKRSNLTGSVSDIKGDKLTQRNVIQTADALQGIAPGVNVDVSSGQPGSQSTIRVRGLGTLTIGASASKNNPLVLIDGIVGNINDVEPNNIESVSVLKDAASSAIYGSRASNGVILIKTKRGEKGELFVNYNVNMGYQVPTDMVEYSGAFDFMTYYNEALENEGKAKIFDDQYIQNWLNNQPNSDEYPSTDWFDVVLKDAAFQQKHSLTVNGGSEKVTNLVNLTYLDQKSIMPNTSFSRFGIRINTDIQATDKLHFGLDIKGASSKDEQPSQGVWYEIHRVKPNQLPLLSDGRYGVGYGNLNPLAQAQDGGLSEGKTKLAVINAKADYKLLDNLTLEFTFAPTYQIFEGNRFIKMYDTYTWEGNHAGTYPTKNDLNVYFNKSQNIYANALLRYKKSIEQHNINIIAGYDQTDYLYEWTRAYRENFVLQDYPVLDAGDAVNQQNSGSGHEWSLRSVYGRVNYNFSEKYLFEANFRYDGSSRFSEGNKYSFFPSFSAGWRISEEGFMEGVDFISNLKLRGSWGMLGNQQIGVYPFLTTVDLGTDHDVVFGEQTHGGASITTYSNEDIKWETTTISDIGLDLGLFNNKLSLVYDYYIKKTEDILLRLPIPATMGFEAPYQNAGVVENKGWDLALSYNDNSGEFKYSATIMLSDVRNKVIDLKDTGPFNYDVTTIREGEPINAIFGYEAEGLFQTQAEVDQHATQFGTVEPGDIKYKDQLTIDSDGDGIADASDGVINADDRVVIGNQIPRFNYSLDLTAQYKGFDARIFIQGVGDVDGYLNGDGVWAFHNGGQLQQWHIDSHWTPDNPDAEYPRYWLGYTNNTQASSYWMKSAAYLRLKNVQLGYTLPKKWLNKLDIEKLRIYVAGDNVFTFDNFYPGWDPETNILDDNNHPFMSSYSIGINVQF